MLVTYENVIKNVCLLKKIHQMFGFFPQMTTCLCFNDRLNIPPGAYLQTICLQLHPTIDKNVSLTFRNDFKESDALIYNSSLDQSSVFKL